jgi:O-6-methylguanine DNA methyltransferase
MIGIYTKKIGDVWFGVACSEQSVFGTVFRHSKQETLKKLLNSIPPNAPFQVYPEPTAFAKTVLSAVKNVYEGKSSPQRLPLATEHLTAYTQRVLEVTSTIPTGYLSSYGAIAKTAGGSPRAVGHFMASNPFAPIVPCHRVVRSDFTLGGYGGGLKTKTELLMREKRGYTSPREMRLGDKKLQVFPVEFVLRKLEING